MQQLHVRETTPVTRAEPAKSANARTFWLALAAVVAVAALMYVTLALTWVKFSRAEVFFAESAREMIVHNNMVTPLYHGEPFFDKPILMYWFIIGMFKSIGITHFAARVPSIIAAVGTLLLTGWVTRKIASASTSTAAVEQAPTAGLLAPMMLASSFMFFGFAYLCMSDMSLVLFDACTMLALYAGIVKEKKRSLLWWLASVSMGLAFVTKGPVGIVLPAAAFLVYLGVTRQLKLIKPLHVVLGAITATLIAMPWFYAAYQANGTWALAYFFIRENFVRYTGSMYDTHKPVWFMVQSLALGFLPWTVLIPFALASQIPQMKAKIAERMNDPKLYMWIWTAVLLGFFSFSRGKCDYYALPVYPAVACLVALHLVEKPNSKLQKISAIVLALLFLTVGIASPIVLTAFSSQMGLASWWAMPAALIISGIVALAACSNRRLTIAFSTLFVGLCLGISGFAIQLFPTVMSSRSIDAYAEAISKTAPNTAIGIHKDLHHWVSELTFQSQREPHELQNSKAVSELFAAGPALVLIPENVYNQALVDEPALQSARLKVVDRRRVSTHPLTPGYVLKRKGNLFDRTLLLISN